MLKGLMQPSVAEAIYQPSQSLDLDFDPLRSLQQIEQVLVAQPDDSVALVLRYLLQIRANSALSLEAAQELKRLGDIACSEGMPTRVQIDYHLLLGKALRSLGKMEEAHIEFESALKKSERNLFFRLQAEALNSLASIQSLLGHYKKSIAYLRQALALSEKKDIGVYKANILINLCSNFRKIGEFERAIAYIKDAFEILNQSGDKTTLIDCLLSTAHLHIEMGDLDSAKTVALKAMAEARTIQNGRAVVVCLNTLGYIELQTAQFFSAEAYFQEAFSEATQYQLHQYAIDNLDGLGQVYTALGRYHEALKVHQEALETSKQIGHSEGEVNALLNLGRDQLALESPKAALDILLIALEKALELGQKRSSFEAHQLLSQAYKRIGDFEQALKHHELFFMVHEEVFNAESEEKARSLMLQFEVERTHQEARIAEEARILAEAKVAQRTAELEQTQLEVLLRLALTAEYRDDQTGQHALRVGQMSARIALELGWQPEDAALLEQAARLHDLGKVGVSDAILNKPGKYTLDEFAQMKAHTSIGARILSGGRSRLMQMAERIAHSHHERFDGAGYPQGLSNEQIPSEARIVAVVDVFDALISERTYKPAWKKEAALLEIQRQSGAHFDPAVVRAFLKVIARQ
ncbi:MAG: HD domain-containing phosphohydrolase [Deinococcales bacterium]